jgi:hypothetical protein
VMLRVHGDRLRASAFVVMAAGSLSFLYFFDPATSDLYPTCPFLALTGCYCPGCGSLRALHQLTRGHYLIPALDLNPFMVLTVPFITYYFASQVMLAVTGRPLKAFFVPSVIVWMLLGFILVYWLLRNIPVYPISLLAP